MKKAKFTVGDKVYVYDIFDETFKHIEIENVRIDDQGTIFYNSRFDEEIVFETLEESYINICDCCTKNYKEDIKRLTEEYLKLCCKEN